MTYNELYRESKGILTKAGLESPAFDTMCLFEKVFGYDRHRLIMEGDNIVPAEKKEQLKALVCFRSAGEPLQYLLGEWTFMGSTFAVGRGVLVPREDTAVVVNLCIQGIKEYFPAQASIQIIDLCAGSGVISIVLAKAFPKSTVRALEYAKEAFAYLEQNIQKNKVQNVTSVFGDVFTHYQTIPKESLDVIISNPPYIERDVIDTLQKEVRIEPRMALDGGADGYDFYKAITRHWTSRLKPGGLLAFELGEGQDETVGHLMKEAGFFPISSVKDMQGINRGIMGVKQHKG